MLVVRKGIGDAKLAKSPKNRAKSFLYLMRGGDSCRRVMADAPFDYFGTPSRRRLE